MEQSLDLNLDHVRPWRRATIAMTTLAALELVALAGASVALLGNPLARHLKASAATAAAPRIRAAAPVSAARATLTRSQTSVLVLNGNGRTGAAAAAADRVTARGYLVGNVGNAPRTGYTRTLVMYRPGYAGEGARLGHDLRVRLVRPLDGLRPRQLLGAHLVLIIGT